MHLYPEYSLHFCPTEGRGDGSSIREWIHGRSVQKSLEFIELFPDQISKSCDIIYKTLRYNCVSMEKKYGRHLLPLPLKSLAFFFFQILTSMSDFTSSYIYKKTEILNCNSEFNLRVLKWNSNFSIGAWTLCTFSLKYLITSGSNLFPYLPQFPVHTVNHESSNQSDSTSEFCLLTAVCELYCIQPPGGNKSTSASCSLGALTQWRMSVNQRLDSTVFAGDETKILKQFLHFLQLQQNIKITFAARRSVFRSHDQLVLFKKFQQSTSSDIRFQF